jgi:hypothetical protein
MNWTDRATLFGISVVAGGVLALLSHVALAADPTVISSTVTGTTSSSNTVSGTNTVKGAATASAPSVQITNSDICKHATGNMGVQTQVFGIATGGTIVVDEHCMRLKSARAMNAIGLKTVAASILSADSTTFKAMWMSGVYPPIDGKLGKEARELWLANPQLLPTPLTFKDLLTVEEYAAWEAKAAPDDFVTKRMNSEGEMECRAEDGNYWSRC